jgi:outer membrane protein assembly factor BamE (lipoprotein component of BamABCDE complex)
VSQLLLLEHESGGKIVKRTARGASILAVALVAGAGCTTYRYMREVTPELEQSRREYVENNPKNDFNNNIAAGRVCKGMSRLQVRVTWGEPDDTVKHGAGQETWTYNEFDPSRGTANYNLRFSGEILQSVDFEHAGAPISTDDRDRQREKERLQPKSPTTPGTKPDGML